MTILSQDLETQDATLLVRAHSDDRRRAEQLRERMLNPLCGLLTDLSALNRKRGGPRVSILSGELTGVHVHHGTPPPKPGSFHIGGFGLEPFESSIRVLGETVERYAGHAVVFEDRFPVIVASAAELAAQGRSVLDVSALRTFNDEQLARTDFPFTALTSETRLGWIEVTSLADGGSCLVPAQTFLLGHQRFADEPRVAPAVTTGTAAHTIPMRALRSALDEVVQLDAAVGHWYGDSRSVRIAGDRRTAVLERVIARAQGGQRPEFHLLPSADLPGFIVACLLRGPAGVAPEVVIGLGSDSALTRAMYRAWLEAVGVLWLADWLTLDRQLQGGRDADAEVRPIFDLEENVELAGTPEGAATVWDRFARCDTAQASELGPDDERGDDELVDALVDAFRDSGKRLFWADLTTADVARLGFSVARVWCPDTLSLPLPSAPFAAHPRFEAYGGFRRDVPHPYP